MRAADGSFSGLMNLVAGAMGTCVNCRLNASTFPSRFNFDGFNFFLFFFFSSWIWGSDALLSR